MKCELCGKEFKMITNTHLKKYHDMTLDEYKEKFGKIADEKFCKERYELSKKSLIKKYGTDKIMYIQSAKDKISKIVSDRYKNGFKNWNDGLTKDTDEKLKIHSERMKKLMSDDEFAKNCRDGYRKYFDDPTKKANWMKVNSIPEAPFECPNKLEQYFDSMTPDNVCFVGDGSFWLKLSDGRNKNPDFKVKGQNKLIELFGDYWHRNEDPKELMDDYKNIGYDCLIFWESEVYNNDVEKEVLDFIGGF